jgi:hypothetical protein
MRTVLIFVLAYVIALLVIVALAGLPQTWGFTVVVLVMPALAAAVIISEWPGKSSA